MHILYICYHRLLEPLGEATVVPYLKCMSRQGVTLDVVSFESKEHLSRKGMLAHQLKEFDIQLHTLPYKNSVKLLSGIFNLLNGVFLSFKLLNKGKMNVIYAKGTIAGFIASVLKLKFRHIKIVFDNDGLWAQERQDAAIWGRFSLLYKPAFWAENFIYRNSDYFIVLSSYAKSYLQTQKAVKNSVFIRPICAEKVFFQDNELDLYAQQIVKDKTAVIYAGAVGTWYMVDEMIQFFKVLKAKKSDMFFVFLTYPQNIEKVKKKFLAEGIENDSFHVGYVAHNEIVKWYSVASAGLYFIKPFVSKKASSPTKLAEMLASGLYVVTNKGIGDTADLLTSNDVGVLCDGFESKQYEKCAEKLLQSLKDKDVFLRCRETAGKYLSMQKAENIYKNLFLEINKDLSGS